MKNKYFAVVLRKLKKLKREHQYSALPLRHFSKVNTFLEEKGLDKIDWGRDPSGQEVAEEQPNPSVVIPHRTLYTSRTR